MKLVNTFKMNCDAEYPDESGELKTVTLRCEFRTISRSKLKALAEGGDFDVLNEFLVGVHGELCAGVLRPIRSAEGLELTPSEAAVQLKDDQFAALGMVKSFLAQINGAKSGNSPTPPASGPVNAAAPIPTATP